MRDLLVVYPVIGIHGSIYNAIMNNICVLTSSKGEWGGGGGDFTCEIMLDILTKDKFVDIINGDKHNGNYKYNMPKKANSSTVRCIIRASRLHL